MRVSELIGPARIRQMAIEPHRKVGVRFTEHHRVMAAAIDLFRNLGVDVDVADQEISVSCGRTIAPQVQALLERRTGIPAFNEWDRG